MTLQSEHSDYICGCGARLLSRRECLESQDEILRHVGEVYLSDEDLFCVEEDDVVPRAWAYTSEADRQRQMDMAVKNAAAAPPSF